MAGADSVIPFNPKINVSLKYVYIGNNQLASLYKTSRLHTIIYVICGVAAYQYSSLQINGIPLEKVEVDGVYNFVPNKCNISSFKSVICGKEKLIKISAGGASSDIDCGGYRICIIIESDSTI